MATGVPQPLWSGRAPTRDADLQRAAGAVRLSFVAKNGVTVASDVYQKSPLRVLFPRTGGETEAVLANTSGGIAGGDTYTYDVSVDTGASVIVTTQAAEKIYRALDRPASIMTRLHAADGAKLGWLPQETILFDGAKVRRTTNLALSSGAQVLALEWLVLGRSARNETMIGGEVTEGWRVTLDGRLIWADTFRIGTEVWKHANRAALLDGCTALVTVLHYGGCAEQHLDKLRPLLETLPGRCGATTVSGLLIARFAAPRASDVRAALKVFLQEFAAPHLSPSFHMPKMWSC